MVALTLKVKQMFDHMKETVSNWNDDEEISNYLHAILDKRIFDKSGLIYGIGHAVYSISDPRAKILEGFAKKLAQKKVLWMSISFTIMLPDLLLRLLQVASQCRKM